MMAFINITSLLKCYVTIIIITLKKKKDWHDQFVQYQGYESTVDNNDPSASTDAIFNRDSTYGDTMSAYDHMINETCNQLKL